MSKSKSIIFSITGIIIVSLFLIAYTFGYVLVKIKGNENSILSSLISKKVSVAYKEISNTSNGETISPGYEFIKTFTATNDGNVEVNYHIYLDNVENEFVRLKDITYTLYRSELNGTLDANNLSDNNIIATGTFPTTDVYIKFNEEIETPNNYYTYALKINYAKTTDSQDEDDGHIFSFRVQLDMNYPFIENTLAYNILNNAVNVTDEEKNNGYAEYMTFPLTIPAQEVSGETESVLSVTSDDYGTSYYYRGNVKNNYVNFAGMCWRIVRIQGDGSVKLTLAAQKGCSEITDSDTDTAFIGTGDYGYTYSSIYWADYENSQNSTSSMKYKFNIFLNGGSFDSITYDANTSESSTETKTYTAWSETAKSKLKTTIACIGDITTKYDDNGAITTNSSYNYDTYVRLMGDGQTANATLICNSKGAKTSETQIFPLTVDEIAFAGGKAVQLLMTTINYYLTDYASSDWWTLSPSGFQGYKNRGDTVFFVGKRGNFQPTFVNGIVNLRPAISLASNTTISKGTGTQTDPYVVE